MPNPQLKAPFIITGEPIEIKESGIYVYRATVDFVVTHPLKTGTYNNINATEVSSETVYSSIHSGTVKSLVSLELIAKPIQHHDVLLKLAAT